MTTGKRPQRRGLRKRGGTVASPRSMAVIVGIGVALFALPEVIGAVIELIRLFTG